MNPFFTDYNILVAIVCAATGLYAGFRLIRSDRSVGWVFLLAFALRSLVSLPGLSFNSVLGFEKDAFSNEQFMWQWSHGARPAFFLCFPGARAYPWLFSFVYEAFGRAPSLIVWLNVVFSSATCYVTAKTAQRLWGVRAARFAGAWLAVFPYFVFQSTVILREAPICICMAVGLFFMVRTVQDFTLARYLAGCFALFLAAMMHDGLILFPLLWIMYMPYALRKAGRLRLAKFLNYLGAVLVLALLGVVTLMGTGKIAGFIAAEQAGQKVGPLDPSISQDSRANYDYMSPKGNPALQIAVIPVLGLFLLITPTIWMVRAAVDVVGFCDALCYAWLLYIIVKNWQGIIRSVPAKGILIATIASAMFLGFGTLNFGTSIRHRAKLLPGLLMMASILLRDPPPKSELDAAVKEPLPA